MTAFKNLFASALFLAALPEVAEAEAKEMPADAKEA